MARDINVKFEFAEAQRKYGLASDMVQAAMMEMEHFAVDTHRRDAKRIEIDELNRKYLALATDHDIEYDAELVALMAKFTTDLEQLISEYVPKVRSCSTAHVEKSRQIASELTGKTADLLGL